MQSKDSQLTSERPRLETTSGPHQFQETQDAFRGQLGLHEFLRQTGERAVESTPNEIAQLIHERRRDQGDIEKPFLPSTRTLRRGHANQHCEQNQRRCQPRAKESPIAPEVHYEQRALSFFQCVRLSMSATVCRLLICGGPLVNSATVG